MGLLFGVPFYADDSGGSDASATIRDGVHEVIDGGNQSGIPYSRGFECFDAFSGQALGLLWHVGHDSG